MRLARLLDLQSPLASVSRRIGPAEDLHAVLQTVLDGMRSLVAFLKAQYAPVPPWDRES